MNFRSLALLVGAGLAAAAPLRAEEPTLPPADAAEIAALLHQRDATPATVTAALPRLPGVALLAAPPAETKTPLRGEMLPGRIGYWGGGFSPRDPGALGLELRNWNVAHLTGLIVDLRHCAPPSTPEAFAEAARLAGCFVPEGTVLFSMQASPLPQKASPEGTLPFSAQALQAAQKIYAASAPAPGLPLIPPPPLVVLVDRSTSGAAEALAEVLRRQAGAIVVGRSTAGEAALFAYPRLKSGRVLRIPTAPLQLADGTPWLGVPVAPDIAVFVDDRMESEALAQIQLGPAARGLVEAPARHRMNEASLVHEENPEIEEILSEQYRLARPQGEAAPLQDVTLMRAVDILKGISLFPKASS